MQLQLLLLLFLVCLAILLCSWLLFAFFVVALCLLLPVGAAEHPIDVVCVFLCILCFVLCLSPYE